MKVLSTSLPGVLVIEPRVYPDPRGQFVESWHGARYEEAGIPGPFVQDNVSVSRRGVLRGLHFQAEPHGQAKLITVLAGKIWDVVVDLRQDAPTFGRWEAHELSSEPLRQLYVPSGFAHGFAVLSDEALVTYRCSEYHHPEAERTLLWNDPELSIDWPIADPLLSVKDQAGATLRELFAGAR